MFPNILVVGTPGCGKTTFAEALSASLNDMIKASKGISDAYKHINVSKLIKDESLYQEWDEERDCSIFDEDLVSERVEDLIKDGGCIVEFHSAFAFEEEWFDGFIVLRCGTSALYDRLKERGYSEKKVQENNEAEIFGICREEMVAVVPDFDELLDKAEEQSEAEALLQEPVNSTEENVKKRCAFEFENDTFERMEESLRRVKIWVHQNIQNQSP